MGTITGLTRIDEDSTLHPIIKGNIALLCHSASIDKRYRHSVQILKKHFGNRLKKIFGPQHGFVCDVQDNMIESDHFHHPHFDLPVYSLYSETRIPTDEMLEGIDTLVVDLQDVGTRVYTYISTLRYVMEKCATLGICVVVLDRPNPVGGEIIEGAMLEDEFASFVGAWPIVQRHALTMGEVGLLGIRKLGIDVEYHVVQMKNWQRDMYWEDTGLPWVNPSPNLSTPNSAHVFPGTVMFEGTNLSEGRGTTRALEMIGHPKTEAYGFTEHLLDQMPDTLRRRVELRPVNFHPMFQKFAGSTCGGVQLHVDYPANATPWSLCQWLCREFKRDLGDDFAWRTDPYEYEYDKLAIDLINGASWPREWVESDASFDKLLKLEAASLDSYQENFRAAKIY
jgi:uncharacterized protein YbbC (DUF1343 family)